MSNKTKNTEQLIKMYKEDPAKENLRALVKQMEQDTFFVPAMLPDTPEVEEMKKQAKENPGMQFEFPEGTAPSPILLKNKEGDAFLQIYTTVGQIPEEIKVDMMLQMKFDACCSLVLNQQSTAQGIAVNPFSDNLIFKNELLELIRKDSMQSAGVKQIKLTPQQFQILMRQGVEFRDLPTRVYEEGAEFVHKISDEKEALVNEIYKKAFQQPKLYPYNESEFSVMPLNISEDLMLVRIDLPATKDKAQLCERIYITLNPKNDEIHYFTIERGKKKGERNLGGISKEIKHVEYGEAPVEGAEIQRIMDIVQQEKAQNS